MKKLARTWRTRRDDEDDKLVLPTWDDIDSRPIDTQEQEEYVLSLEEWKRVFVVLLCCYGAFLLYSIFSAVPVTMGAEWIAIMACCLSIVGLQDKKNNHRRWFWYSCIPGSGLTIFWLYYLLRLPKFRWDAIWLPFVERVLVYTWTIYWRNHLKK